MAISPQLDFDIVLRPPLRVERGSVVRLAGRLCVVLGFEPVGASSPTAYLQDAETGEYRSATHDEMTAPPAHAATAPAA
jgi:hypothetical protein